MEETTLEFALNDIKTIRTSFEVTNLYQGGDTGGDKLRDAVQQARESLLKNLNASVSLLPEELDQVFKHSAMLLISPGVRRGFIDSLMKVKVLCHVARSTETDKPERELYVYIFSREVDYFNISQMCGEQLFTLFLADIIENASNDATYENALDFDRNVAEKFIALIYGIKVARRVYLTGEWPSADEDDPPSQGGGEGGSKPDPGGSGVPRVPLTPTLIGAAANEIPREVLYEDALQLFAPLLERIRV